MALALLLNSPASAQDHQHHEGMDHGAMERPAMPVASADKVVMADAMPPFMEGSGTARLPGAEGAMPGLHIMPGEDWMLMAHGWVQANYTDHKGPRGDDLFYSTSMAMLSAQKDFGGARLQLKS
ncbi:MAG TPA: hypothetical protein VL918_05640, partial [Sphingobium sp.]|nr:hypothetical protein [Sphingobium sp.]